MEIDEYRTASIFKALCDPKRVLIVKLLKSGEKCACDIKDELNIAQSALSYHMKILCESEIVECWYVGKWTHYKISQTGSALAIELLTELTNADENAQCLTSNCLCS